MRCKNVAALLELALVSWVMQKMVGKGFTAVLPPDLVRDFVVEGCGFQPRDPNAASVSEQTYRVSPSARVFL